MFWWALNALLSSIAGMFWKKSLSLSDLPQRMFFAVGTIGSIVLSLGILAFWGFEAPPMLWLLLFPLIDAPLVTFGGMLSQRIYKEEKISTLMPFENLSSVFMIVAAFFIFGDTPFATLAIAIVTIVLIFWFSFDFKRFEFPNNFKLILLSNTLNASRGLAFGYVLSRMTSMTFFSVRNLTTAVLVLVPILIVGEWRTLKTAKRDYLAPRLAASFMWAVSALIGFTLISKLGLVTSTLLGFLSMASTLTLSYFFLGDKPLMKNVVLSIIVAGLVALGAYFRMA